MLSIAQSIVMDLNHVMLLNKLHILSSQLNFRSFAFHVIWILTFMYRVIVMDDRGLDENKLSR